MGPAKEALIRDNIIGSTLQILRDRYGVNIDAPHWTDPGWTSHIRLRDPEYWKPRLDDPQSTAGGRAPFEIDWLPKRLEDRWFMSAAEADEAVNRYARFAQSAGGRPKPPLSHASTPPGASTFCGLSDIARVAIECSECTGLEFLISINLHVIRCLCAEFSDMAFYYP